MKSGKNTGNNRPQHIEDSPIDKRGSMKSKNIFESSSLIGVTLISCYLFDAHGFGYFALWIGLTLGKLFSTYVYDKTGE